MYLRSRNVRNFLCSSTNFNMALRLVLLKPCDGLFVFVIANILSIRTEIVRAYSSATLKTADAV